MGKDQVGAAQCSSVVPPDNLAMVAGARQERFRQNLRHCNMKINGLDLTPDELKVLLCRMGFATTAPYDPDPQVEASLERKVSQVCFGNAMLK